MKIIQQRERIEKTVYMRTFEYLNTPEGSHHGFAFDCDKDGNLFGYHENYSKCLSGEIKVRDTGIETRTYTYTDPRIGECECGEHVYLEHFTNTCGCGRDYNMSGDELAPREQWGDDTGENLSDILRIK